MGDLRQSREYGEYLSRRGWLVERSGEIQVFIRRLGPVAVLKAQRFRVGQMDWEKLKRLKKKYRVIYTVLEPVDRPVPGYQLNRAPYLPTKTVVVDLKKELGLSKDTHQILKRSVLKRSVLQRRTDLIRFWREWKKNGKGYVLSWPELMDLVASFKDKIWVLEVPAMAGVIVLVADKSAYYYFAWTNEAGRKAGAQYALVAEAMKLAKKKGLRWWDFEGIEDERWPRKSWRGFSRFKKKFGGQIVSYPGSFGRWF